MFKRIVLAVIAFIGALSMCSLVFHATLSPFLPYKPFVLFDVYCLPTPPGYLKTSNGCTVFFIKIPAKPWVKVGFPFADGHAVTCTQGNRSHYGRTHFYTNTLYALDLASPPDQPAGVVQAVFGGRAFTQTGCEHHGDTNACGCNGGFGNNVRIVQPDGTYALYAHLSSVMVHEADQVKAGDAIGVEGSSGAAGHRHLHFSIHKTESPEDLTVYQTPGLSIPFVWNIRYQNESEYRSRSSLEIETSQLSFTGTDLSC